MVSVTFVSSTEEERLEGWWESSVPWQGSPHSTVPVLLWQDSHTSGIPAEVTGGGEAIPYPGSSASHATVLGDADPPRRVWCVVCDGCWGCPAWPVPRVCLCCSCLAVGNACCSVPAFSSGEERMQ